MITSKKLYKDYAFMNFGPTTDNFSSRVTLLNEHLDIFVNDEKLGKQRNEIPISAILEIYKNTITSLTT